MSEFITENRPDIRRFCSSADDIEEVISSSFGHPQSKKAMIKSRTARRWLNKLGFSWRDVKKGVFLDGHERDDVVEDRKKFLKIMDELSPYLVEFNADGTQKPKEYPPDCILGGPGCRPVVLITHDESIFSANDGRHQAWIAENGAFLRPKGKGRGIMVSDFLLPWSRLNLLSLPKARQDELVAAGIPREAAVLFEYGKDEGYWDGSKVLDQAINKALPIAEALYPEYQLVFIFDNATSHSVYAEDALRVAKMNKGEGGQQPLLRNGWYKDGDVVVEQEMFFTREDPATGTNCKVPKGIQRVLEERGLWPDRGLLLECAKPTCEPCSQMLRCKDCIKGIRCESCKEKKIHSGKCDSKRTCDNCERRKERCQCVTKRVCARCQSRQKRKCEECESLPPKCDSNSQLAFSLVMRLHQLTICLPRLLCPPTPLVTTRLHDTEMRDRGETRKLTRPAPCPLLSQVPL